MAGIAIPGLGDAAAGASKGDIKATARGLTVQVVEKGGGADVILTKVKPGASIKITFPAFKTANESGGPSTQSYVDLNRLVDNPTEFAKTFVESTGGRHINGFKLTAVGGTIQIRPE